MTIQKLKDKWPLYAVMIGANALMLFCTACPSKTTSLITPGKKVTRPELQIELDSIIATAEFRVTDLDKQDAFRNIIMKNALIMVETGTFNPIGIATGLFAAYGIGNAASKVKKSVKKKTKPPD